MANHLIGELFAENYIDFKKYLHRRYQTLSEYDVEDIIQHTVLKLLTKGDDLGNITDLSKYMYSSLSNGAKDHFKKESRIELHGDESEHFESPTLSLEEEMLLKELKQVIKEAIFSLDDKYRFIFIETEFKGKSYASLSKETGEKTGTLLSRKNRAKKILQRKISEYLEDKRL